MKKILLLSGSIKKNSFNTSLIREASAIADKLGAKTNLIDLKDFEMPIYNGDLELKSGLPESAIKLREIFIDYNKIIIASPEYNSSFSPLLKNSLDWISRPYGDDKAPLVAFKNKVVALISASPSALGGKRGLEALRIMLNNINVKVISDQLTIPFAPKAFDENGKLIDSETFTKLENVVQKIIEFDIKTIPSANKTE